MTLFILSMLALTVVGCSSDLGETGSKTIVEDDSQQEIQNFNPDEASGIEYRDLVAELSTIPFLDESLMLGGVAKSFQNEYWRTLRDGMEKGVDLFSQNGFDVTIEVSSAREENDEQGQLAIVSNMINQDYSALLLSPISDSNLGPGVINASEIGIPTINVNDGIIEEADYFVGPKARENGELAAAWLVNKLDGEGEVAIIMGMPKAFAARQRTIGFEEYMEENAPEIEIVAVQNADWDRARAKDIAETWIKMHPNLNAIFANNDTMALGVQEAVNASGRDILVIGVDGTSEAYESIRNGELAATVDSFPYFKGQIAVEIAMRRLAEQEIPRVIWTPQALIDSTNANKSAEEIIQWSELKFE